MAHVQFNKDFSYWPNGQTRIDYKAGHQYPVHRACADQAIAAEAGVEVEAPTKDEANGKDNQSGKPAKKASDVAGSGNADDPKGNGSAG